MVTSNDPAMMGIGGIEIRVPPPYDFLGCVKGHGWVALEPFALTETGFHRVEHLRTGRVVAISITAADADEATVVRVTTTPTVAPEEQTEIREKVRSMLRLDEDFSEFYALCAERGEAYRSAVGRGRLLRSPTVLEDAFKVLCTTNTTWQQTRAMVARTVRALGAPLPGDGQRRAFPTAAAMIEAGERFFAEEARMGYRARAAIALAERAADLEALRDPTIPTAELRRRLLTLKGFGPYAAATMLMLLGRYEHLAVDSEARAFVAKKYLDDRRPSDAEIHRLYADWGRWKYLGQWLDA